MRFLNIILTSILPLLATSSAHDQKPLIDPTMSDEQSTQTDHNIFLSDILSSDRSINIFAGFTRDFAQLSQRFEDGARNTTILAPLNSVIMNLPRKPWEDKDGEDDTRVKIGDGSEQAKENLKRFVEAHVVPVSPWSKGKEGKIEALAGGSIWWEEKDGKRYVSIGRMRFDQLLIQNRSSLEILRSRWLLTQSIMVRYGY